MVFCLGLLTRIREKKTHYYYTIEFKKYLWNIQEPFQLEILCQGALWGKINGKQQPIYRNQDLGYLCELKLCPPELLAEHKGNTGGTIVKHPNFQKHAPLQK